MRHDCTWVVVEYDVEEVLVSPGDVVLVLLIERMQKILPGQAAGDHAVLKIPTAIYLQEAQKKPKKKKHTHTSKEEHIYIPISIHNLLAVLKLGWQLN